MTNWGILGTANIARKAIAPELIGLENNKLLAVASRSQVAALSFASEFGIEAIQGYSKLLERKDIDTVYVPLPTGMHFEWVKKALKAKKNVLVEKTAFMSIDEALEMIELAKESNLVLIENFQFQFHSQHQFVKELIKTNDIGKLRIFRSSFGFPPFNLEDNIRYDKKLGGGALLDAGAYTLKVIDFLFEEKFEVTDAFLSYHDEYKVDWYGGGMLVNSEKNLLAQVAFGFDNYYQCKYEIWGSKGRIISHRAYTAKSGFNPIVSVEKDGQVLDHELPSDNHFKNMIIHFNNCITDQKLRQEEYDKIKRQAIVLNDFSLKANSKN